MFLSAAQNPEAQDKCYEEIVSVIGEVPEEDRPTCRDLDDMPYLIGAIKEALRVRTVTTVFARSIPDDLNVGGNALRKCVCVCVCMPSRLCMWQHS